MAMAMPLTAGQLIAPALADDSIFRAWASDCLTKILRDAKPPDEPGVIQVYGARGEVVSAQAVCWSREPLRDVACQIEDLEQRGSNAIIPSNAISLMWERYIDVQRNTVGVSADELIAKAPTSIPDPFWEEDSTTLKAQQAQPLWIEIDIPRTASSGDYSGILSFSGSGKRARLLVKLHVWDFEIPEERHISIINWWNFPGLGFEGRVEPFSEEYWQLLGRFCRFLVAHRQTDVNASLDWIPEIGTPGSGYSHDTSHLEKFSEIAFEAGIQRIHLHWVGRKANRGVVPVVTRARGMRRLAAFNKQILVRGWQDQFLVSICDEPFPQDEESYAHVVNVVHEKVPNIRCIEAVEAEYLGELDIYVPKLSHYNLWRSRFEQARRTGAELWFYTCCHPVGRYPNRFLDQSLLKVRVLHWINYLHDLKGYLHWGLNQFYGDNPYSEDGISWNLPLGDRAIVYPGQNGLIGSLRFSAQRDGIQDYEYLWLLENQLRQIKSQQGADANWLDPRQRPLEFCKRVVWSCYDYTRSPEALLDTRMAIAEEIESLTAEHKLIVQTSPPEGTYVPAGPRHIIVRGLAPVGAAVKVNGTEVQDVGAKGYFVTTQFLDDDTDIIEVSATGEGYALKTQRQFRLTQGQGGGATSSEPTDHMVSEAGKVELSFKKNQYNATTLLKFREEYEIAPLVIVSEWNSSGTFVILKAERVSKERCSITGHRIDGLQGAYHCQVAYIVVPRR
jgi:hypothetical protein